MGRIGEKTVSGRGRRTQVAGSKELPLAMLQHGESQRSAFMLQAKVRTHRRYLHEESKEAMQEDYSQEGTTGRIQIASTSGAPKETDTGTNRRLSMAGVGEGPIGNCIEGEPESRDASKGQSGRPESECQEPPSILLTGWTQDILQSGGTRGKVRGDTYAEGRPTCHEKRELSWKMVRPPDRPTLLGQDGACVVV